MDVPTPMPILPRVVGAAVAALISAAIAVAPTANTVTINRDDRPWLLRTGGRPPDD